eukprot:1944687-Rhodomonas_salina.1
MLLPGSTVSDGARSGRTYERPGMGLRKCYAMSGTDVAVVLPAYAMPGTERFVWRCYQRAMPGTDILYGGTTSTETPP